MSSFQYRVWDGKKMLSCGVDSNGFPIKFDEKSWGWLPIGEHPDFKGDTAPDNTDVMVGFGAKDVKKRYIFEGDILYFPKLNEKEHIPEEIDVDGTVLKGFDAVDKFYGEVVWEPESFSFKLKRTGAVVTYIPDGKPQNEAYHWLNSSDIEDAIEEGAYVVGNIYSRPDLRHLEENE